MSKHKFASNNLKLLRIQRGISQLDLAAAAKCSQTTVSACENCLREITGILRKRFADALQVPEQMIDEPVCIIPKSWDRLITDARMHILIEELLSYDSRRLSREVHKVCEARKVHNFAL